MILRRACLALCLVGLLIAPSIARAQSVQPASLRLVLKGYDPVAYFTDGKPIQGKSEYEAVYDEARYRFASFQHPRPMIVRILAFLRTVSNEVFYASASLCRP